MMRNLETGEEKELYRTPDRHSISALRSPPMAAN